MILAHTIHEKWEKNEKIQKKLRKSKKDENIQKKISFNFFHFSLPPENLPEDRNSGNRSFTGPDGLGSASKTTGRTGFSISKPEKRPGQLEINFTGFLHTQV